LKQLSPLCLVGIFLLIGCAGMGAREEKPANELIQDGITRFDKGDYRKAIEAFEQLKDWYPFSKYAILAELRIADAHFFLDEYADAVIAYEEFEQLHPRNEAIPYVIYQIGKCHFNQIDTIDRDQTPAEKALAAFQRLIKQYPDTPLSRLARGHIDTCLKSLAGHEFYVGLFYYRARHYEAALGRFQALITRYPDVGIHQKALPYIANCQALIREQPASAREQEEKLILPE
jgi:outer membrane protein assembly factor BamD